MPKFRCPACKELVSIPKESSSKGARVTCSSCGRAFVVTGLRRRKKKKKTAVSRTDSTPSQIMGAETVCGAPKGAKSSGGTGTPRDPSDHTPAKACAAGKSREQKNPHLPADGIPGFVIIELLGQGGMGAVYKARQLSLDRVVALKLLAKRLSEVADFVKRFEKEAKALASLNHPNITSIYDRGVTQGCCYFAMEYVAGTNLAQVLASGRLEPEETIRLFLQMCDAIAYSHGNGIIHRDLKPGNILVTPSNNIKVTDFGLAAMMGEDRFGGAITRTNMVMGTVNYMAPEQRRDSKSVDHRADIYSLGVILYEMLTGQLPLGHFELPSALTGGAISARIDEIIVKALAANPDRRYPKVEYLVADIRDIEGRIFEAPAFSTQQTVVGPAGPPASSGDAPVPAQTSPGQASAETSIDQPPSDGGVWASSTLLQQAPVTHPPQAAAVFSIEYIVGRILLYGMGLAFLLISLSAFIPRAYLPVPVLRMRESFVAFVSGDSAVKAEQLIEKKIVAARAAVRTGAWKDVPVLIEPILNDAGEHRFEALYLLGKSLAEWGAVSGNRSMLLEAQQRLDAVDSSDGKLFPDLLYYRARVRRLLGETGQAVELYGKSISLGLMTGAATREMAIALSDSGDDSRALTILSSSPAAVTAQSCPEILPICRRFYESIAKRKNVAPDSWRNLDLVTAALAGACGEKDAMPGLLAALVYSHTGRDTKSIRDRLRAVTSGEVPQKADELRYFRQALLALADHAAEQRVYTEVEAAYRKYIDSAGSKPVPAPDVLSMVRRNYGELLVRSTRRYDQAAALLELVRDEDRDFTYCYCLGRALFLPAQAGLDGFFPVERPSGAALDSLKRADGCFERALGLAADGGTSLRDIADCRRYSARVKLAACCFPEAAAAWSTLIAKLDKLKTEHDWTVRYADEARLSLVRLFCDVKELRALPDWKSRARNRFYALSPEASTGPLQRPYLYAAILIELNGKSPLKTAINKARKNIDSLWAIDPDYGDIAFFKALSVFYEGDTPGRILACLEKMRIRDFSFWSTEAFRLKGIVNLRLARLCQDNDGRKKLLLKAERACQAYRDAASPAGGQRVEQALKEIRLLLAEIDSIDKMTLRQLREALQFKKRPVERTPLVLRLVDKLQTRGDSREALNVLLAEKGRQPGNVKIAVRCAVLQARVDGKLDALWDALKMCRNSPDDIRKLAEVIKPLQETVPPEQSIKWWERILETDPGEAVALGEIAARLEELGRTGRTVAVYEKAVESDPHNALLLFSLQNWRLELARYLAGEGKEDEGRAVLEKAVVDCRACRDKVGDKILLGRIERLAGLIQRELGFIDPEGGHTRLAVEALKMAISGLDGLAEGVRIRALACSDLAEIYRRSRASTFEIGPLTIAVKSLGSYLAASESHDDQDIELFWQSVTNLAWAHMSGGDRAKALDVVDKALSVEAIFNKSGTPEIRPRLLFARLVLGIVDNGLETVDEAYVNQARNRLEEAVAADPSNPGIRQLLARLLIHCGDIRQARREVEAAQSLLGSGSIIDEDDEFLVSKQRGRQGEQAFLQGLINECEGHYEKARNAYLRAIGLGGNAWASHIHISRIAQNQGSAESIREALAELEKAAESAKLPERESLRMIDLCLLSGDGERSLRLAKKAKDSAPAFFRRGVALFWLGRYGESVEPFSEALACLENGEDGLGLTKSTAARFYAQALVAGQGAWPAACRYFQLAADSDEHDAWSNYYLGRQFLRSEKYEQAYERSVRAAGLLNTNYSATLQAAVACLKANKDQQAERLVARAISLAPDRPEPFFLSAVLVRRRNGRRVQIKTALGKAVEKAPAWKLPRVEMGFLSLPASPAGAEDCFRKILPGACGEPRAYLGLGLSLAVQGKDRQSVGPLLNAVLYDETRALAAYNLACVFAGPKLNKPQTALAWLRFACKSGYSDAESAANDPDLKCLGKLVDKGIAALFDR